jgi:xanthine dehydrogenase accessory factor
LTDAVFDGVARLDGLSAQRIDDLAALEGVLAARDTVPLSLAAFDCLLAAYQPAVLVDARMRKRTDPDSQRGLAPLTVGLGPNFVAGENVDVAVETSWEALGRVVREGPMLPLRGEPRAIAGHGRDRYVYTPVAGVFRTERAIGERVEAGECVATVEGTPLLAPLSGILRGLVRDGVPVALRTKVIEVDPRGNPSGAHGIGERPRRIAEGVLAAVQEWESS